MEIYKPAEPWYVGMTQSSRDPTPTCVAAKLGMQAVLMAVYAPTQYQTKWTCMLAHGRGKYEAELPNVNPNDDSPETWRKAQADAIDAITKQLEAEIQWRQDAIKSLQNLK